jgi:hypothetical protein
MARCRNIEIENIRIVFKEASLILKLMEDRGVKIYVTGVTLLKDIQEYSYLSGNTDGKLEYLENVTSKNVTIKHNLDKLEYFPYLQLYRVDTPFGSNGQVELSLVRWKQYLRLDWHNGDIKNMRDSGFKGYEYMINEALSHKELHMILLTAYNVMRNNNRMNIDNMIENWEFMKQNGF